MNAHQIFYALDAFMVVYATTVAYLIVSLKRKGKIR